MKSKSITVGLRRSVILAILVPVCAPALAQQSGPTVEPTIEEEADNSGIASIVVTGRKRAKAEELQKTPLAITALSAEQLQSPTFKTLVDIGRTTPNAALQPSAQRGVQNFTIRGMGLSGTTVSDEPTVGIFQDGVYWGSNYGALGDTFDLEGLEIFRGPQGTLFGRNVTGGAVTIRSARPTSTPSARLMAGIGNGMMAEGSVMVNGPIGEDLDGRIAVLGRFNNGLYRNVTNNSSYGENNTVIIRPSLRWQASSNLDITVLGELYKLYGDPMVTRGISPTTIPGGARTAAELAGFTSPSNFFATNPGSPGFNVVNVYFGMLEANWQIGPGVLTSITGYRKVRSRNDYDADGFPPMSFSQFVANDQNQWSTELRYAADISDWLSGTVGLYYFDQNVDYLESRILSGGASRVGAGAQLENESYAAFAEVDITPVEALTITLGARYTHETKDAAAAAFGQCTFDLTTCNYQVATPYKANDFSPKIGVSYQITPEVLAFGSFTRGFRSGGYSLRGTALGAPYEAETVEAFEAGLKTDLFDRRVRLNATVFHNKFSNLQRTVLGVDPILGVVQSVFNAADATIKGAELELIVAPTQGLTLSGSYGYTDPAYKSFQGFANPRSLRFVRVPKHTASASVDYNSDVGSSRIALHAGLTYTSRYFFNDANTPTLEQGGYVLGDASIAWTLPQDVTISLYSRNLFNKEYAIWGSTLGALGQNIFPGEPRTFGIRVTADF